MKLWMMFTLLCASLAVQATKSYGASPNAAPQISPDSSSQSVNPVLQWNRVLLVIVRTPGAQPATIHPTRSFAILQAAEYDAVVSTTHADRPYLFSVAAPRDARPDVAADQAAHDVLTALYPTMTAGADQLLTTGLAAVPDGASKQDGVRVGQAVAAHLVTVRSDDGSAVTPPPFVAGTQPGDYRPTPPASTRFRPRPTRRTTSA